MKVNPFNPVTNTKVNPFNPVSTSTTPKYSSDAFPTTFAKTGSINLAGLPTVEGGGANTPLGIAYNTVVGLPQAAVDTAKNIAQGVARTVASVGVTAGNVPTQIVNKVAPKYSQPLPFDQEIDTTTNPISNAVFGGQPVKTIQKQAEDVKTFLKPYIGEKPAGISAYPLVGLGIALDLSGFGGGKSVKLAGEIPEQFFKVVAKDSNPTTQFNRLLKNGMDGENAKALAPILAETKTTDEVKAIVKDWKPISPATEPTTAPTIQGHVSPESPQYPSIFPAKATGVQQEPSVPLQSAKQIPESLTPTQTSPTVDLQKESSYRNSIQQKILDAKQAQGLLDDFVTVEPNISELDHPTQRQAIRDLGSSLQLPEKVANTYKDISVVKKQFRDVYRNTEQVFGKDFPAVKSEVLDPFDASKGQYIDTLNTELDYFEKNIFSKFKKGSKEDKAIQGYGEKAISYDTLVKDFGKSKADEIVKAEQWFRGKYDNFIDNINKVEQQIYPNSPYKWTPKRADYFRHYHELSSDFSRLQNILENPIRIDPMLEGISQATKPKSKWASFKQQRLGKGSTQSAMGGYLDYLPSYSYALNIDQHIGKFRELAESLARMDHKTKNLNNYIYNLQMFANELSGKTSELDRIATDFTGRRVLQAVDWANKRVKSNTILGSTSASLAQLYNLPQGVASSGATNFLKGVGRTLAENFVENPAMKKSTFLKERYFKGFNKFDTGIANSAKKTLMWLVSVGDEIGTKTMWNSQYELAKSKGIDGKAAVQFADQATRKLVGGRGIGEKSLIQNSKVFQIFAPFQLEVTNLWWVMEDLAKSDASLKKKIGQFMTLFAGLYITNSIVEKITGNRPVLDPIQMTLDAATALQNEQYAMAGGRVAGEVLANIPLGQTAAALYPEYGTTMFGQKLPSRKQLFGRVDPTRFGGGPLVVKGATDPLFKILPPFGGAQIKKTIQGVQAYNKGKSTNVSGDLQYKIKQTPSNFAAAALFGKSATKEGKAYYDKQNAPKKTKNTKTNPFNPI